MPAAARCFLCVVLFAACGDSDTAPAPSTPPTEEPSTVEEDAERVLAALREGSADDLAAMAAVERGVRVEVRQALVETDEREAEVLEGADAVRRWARRLQQDLGCDEQDEACRWPRGLVTEGARRCFGDCCDWGQDARSVEEGALRLRRVCLVARENGERRLTYLGFVEAR